MTPRTVLAACAAPEVIFMIEGRTGTTGSAVCGLGAVPSTSAAGLRMVMGVGPALAPVMVLPSVRLLKALIVPVVFLPVVGNSAL